MKKTLLLLALISPAALAQVSTPSITPVTTVPSGACAANLPVKMLVPAGILYPCQNGTYGPVGGGGGSAIVASSASLMPHWIACTAKVKINAGSCRVLAVGDSTTMGAYSSAGNVGELFAGAYPARLSQYLNSSILPAQRDSFMGAGGNSTGTSVLFNDARIVSTGWTGSSSASVGGDVFTATSTAALAFTPTDQVNQFTLWYLVNNPTTGVLSWSIDSGTTTNVTQSGATGVFSLAIPAGSLGIHVLHLNWVSGTVFFLGVEAVNTAIGSANVINAGFSGSTAVIWNNSSLAWRAVPAVVTLAPDVILLDLGINDWNTGTGESIASFTSNMQALITAWKPTSDIILVTPAPSSIAGTGVPPLATQEQYVAATYSLAAANNLPIIDNFNRWGSFELKNPAPFLFYGNPLHPSANGYSDFAQSIAAQLLSIVGN
jgi:lysophospholipase L1-like esterase